MVPTDDALFFYKAALVRVVDGDTVDLTIDLGFRIAWTQRFRLAGINTPEMNAADPAVRERAKLAAEFLKGVLLGGEIRVETDKDKGDKYGRWLATIYVRTSTGWLCANEMLVEAELAVRYYGG